mmetsp:Transcript_3693/g.8153  ORF Transcript_3693/g.8153 Transcript_3693/m.8153 type:complete len:354 (+) Transcript_3693:69-1130(+)
MANNDEFDAKAIPPLAVSGMETVSSAVTATAATRVASYPTESASAEGQITPESVKSSTSTSNRTTAHQASSSSGAMMSHTAESPSAEEGGPKPESVQSSSASSKKIKITNNRTSSSGAASSTSSARPAKKAKKEKKAVEEKHSLEIKWYEYDVENDADVNHSMFADDIPKRGKFSDSRAFLQRYEGENHQYGLTMCLVDGKSEHRKVLVEMDVYYWYLPINLMHFHILSQDLANFCRKLWVAAGKNEDVYDDMSIEFGYCKNGKVAVKTLVGKAMGIKRKSDVMYVRDVKMHPGSTVKDSLELIEMIFKKCPSTIVIAYEVDLKKLGVDKNFANIGFQKMPNDSCYIGPNRKF